MGRGNFLLPIKFLLKNSEIADKDRWIYYNVVTDFMVTAV